MADKDKGEQRRPFQWCKERGKSGGGQSGGGRQGGGNEGRSAGRSGGRSRKHQNLGGSKLAQVIFNCDYSTGIQQNHEANLMALSLPVTANAIEIV